MFWYCFFSNTSTFMIMFGQNYKFVICMEKQNVKMASSFDLFLN